VHRKLHNRVKNCSRNLIFPDRDSFCRSASVWKKLFCKHCNQRADDGEICYLSSTRSNFVSWSTNHDWMGGWNKWFPII